MWNTTDYKNNPVTWYSENTINKIKDFLNKFCGSVCPHAESASDICNNGCLLDEIAKPIFKILGSEGNNEK